MDKKELLRYKDFYHSFLLDNVILFWEKSDLIDKKYGGFITSVDQEGKSYNDDKSVWFQGRALWTFSKLCNTYGVKPLWKEASDLGASFIKEHCIDKDERMFFTVMRDGKPLRKRRYYFSESFLVVAFGEYYLLTKNEEDLLLAEHYFDLMWQIYKDPSKDPFKITPKENAKVRLLRSNANPMVLLSSAQELRRIDPQKREYYDEIIRSLIGDMIGLHYKEEYHCVLENVFMDGSILDNPTGRTINPGRSIENSWFLMNYAAITKDKNLLQKALNILNWSLERGWDKEYGGVYYLRDLFDRPCEQLEFDMKLWWVHNECLIATLAAYSLTKDERYWEAFKTIHEYSFSRFADKEYGEWYGYLHRDGSVSHTQKGSLWKGPYHLPRCLIDVEKILESLLQDEPLPELL